MLIGGVDPSVFKNEYVLVLPRQDGQIVLKARGLTQADNDRFKEICPEPKPPSVLTKDGRKEHTEDENYQKTLEHYYQRRFAWIVITSLEPSDIKWDTVELDKPKTWQNWESDLDAAGFSRVEIQRIGDLCLEANSLDEQKLEDARQAFLRGQQPE